MRKRAEEVLRQTQAELRGKIERDALRKQKTEKRVGGGFNLVFAD